MFRRSFSAKMVALLLLMGTLVGTANLGIILMVEELVTTIARDWIADASLRGIKRVDEYLRLTEESTACLADTAGDLLEEHWSQTKVSQFPAHFRRADNGTLVSVVHSPGYRPGDPATYPEQAAAHGPREGLYRPGDDAKKFLLITDQYAFPALKLAGETVHSVWIYLLHQEVSVTYPFADQAVITGPDFLNSTRPYYQTLRDYDGKGRWTDPYLDMSGKGWMMTRAHPILFRGKPFGLAVQDISLHVLNDTLNNIRLSQTEIAAERHERGRPLVIRLIEAFVGGENLTDKTRVFLVKPDGRMLTTNDENLLQAMKDAGGVYYLWKAAGEPNGAAADVSGKYHPGLIWRDDGKTHVRGIVSGNDILFAYPMKSTGWIALVEADATEIFSAIRGVRLILLSVTFIGIWLAILVGYLFSNRFITRPVLAISKAANLISKGDLGAKVRDFGQDEIGRLAKSFNNMVDGLRARQHEKRIFGYYVSTTIRDRILKSEDALSGQDVEAVILFSDIRSFSTYSENKQPKEVVDMLNRLFSRMVNAVQDNGGVVDKFIGDAIMAVFGDYLGTREPYRAAVRAAVEMRRQLAEFNRELAREGKEPIELGIGIHGGHVISGDIGSPERRQYTVIGNAVDIASRLETETKTVGCPILVSAEVRDRCGAIEGVNFTDAKEVHVKGISRPIQVYKVQTSETRD